MSSNPTSNPHVPVLCQESIDWLNLKDGGTYVDGTFGAGGYTRAMLASCACNVLSIDRDPLAVDLGRGFENEFPDRFKMLHGQFGQVEDLLNEQNITQVDGMVLDLGVSSMQLDTPDRGFSFRFDAPLNMRMDQGSLTQTQTVSDILNNFEEEEIANIIYKYGEERKSRWIARAIVKRRQVAPITRTTELVDIVSSVVRRRPGGSNPATRTFQALRIFLNDELGELERALSAAERILRPGGRLVIVTFHSLEDRQVKLFLKQRSGRVPSGSRHLPVPNDSSRQPTFNLLTGRAVPPSEEEILSNTRARSAHLRAAERTDAPVWDDKAAA